MNVAVRALALALLARRRTPQVCTYTPGERSDIARRSVADEVADRNFQRFVREAAARRLDEDQSFPWAILTPALLRTTGLRVREMPLPSWAAAHIWRHHGPAAESRRKWERLEWSDWLLAQRVIDEVAPEMQPDGRW